MAHTKHKHCSFACGFPFWSILFMVSLGCCRQRFINCIFPFHFAPTYLVHSLSYRHFSRKYSGPQQYCRWKAIFFYSSFIFSLSSMHRFISLVFHCFWQFLFLFSSPFCVLVCVCFLVLLFHHTEMHRAITVWCVWQGKKKRLYSCFMFFTHLLWNTFSPTKCE